MNAPHPWLAQAAAADAPAHHINYTSTLWQNIFVFGAMFLAVLAVIIWMFFFRKRGHPRHHKHRPHHWVATGVLRPGESADNGPAGEPRRAGRRSRRHHLSRNPTLADTRGLPPVRPASPATPPPGP